jgi:hypothetical protein
LRLAPTLAALALALPLPLLAQSADPRPEASPSPGQDGGEKVICKQEKATGSRVPAKKTCLTEKQWRDKALQAQEGVAHRTRMTTGN